MKINRTGLQTALNYYLCSAAPLSLTDPWLLHVLNPSLILLYGSGVIDHYHQYCWPVTTYCYFTLIKSFSRFSSSKVCVSVQSSSLYSHSERATDSIHCGMHICVCACVGCFADVGLAVCQLQGSLGPDPGMMSLPARPRSRSNL